MLRLGLVLFGLTAPACSREDLVAAGTFPYEPHCTTGMMGEITVEP